jgi:hypothetical protein
VPSAYQAVELDAFARAVPGVGHDFAAMFAFFQHRDLLSRDRDVEALRILHPGLATFGDWLSATGWEAPPRPDCGRRPTRARVADARALAYAPERTGRPRLTPRHGADGSRPMRRPGLR